MNELLMDVALCIGFLLLCLLIPGIKEIASGLLKLLMEGFGALVKGKATFVIWAIKRLVSDHARVFEHARKSKYELDPTQKVHQQDD